MTTTCSPASGSLFPIGSTVLSCTATDKAGTKASCQSTVQVLPPQLPDAVSPMSQAIASGATAATTTVTTASTCGWTATSGVNWITVTAGASGKGNGKSGTPWPQILRRRRGPVRWQWLASSERGAECLSSLHTLGCPWVADRVCQCSDHLHRDDHEDGRLHRQRHLSAGGLPNAATATFSASPATGTSSTLTVAIGKKTTEGTYQVTITGTDGNLTARRVTLVVAPHIEAAHASATQ